jgi:hypothetical protein
VSQSKNSFALLAILLVLGIVGIVFAQEWMEPEEEALEEYGENGGIRPVYCVEDESACYWVFDQDMEESLDELLLSSIRKKYGISLDSDMMSRCVSYVGYTLTTGEDGVIPLTEGGYYYGEAEVYEGCGGPVGGPIPFRIAINGESAEIQDADASYISVEDWLAL